MVAKIEVVTTTTIEPERPQQGDTAAVASEQVEHVLSIMVVACFPIGGFCDDATSGNKPTLKNRTAHRDRYKDNNRFRSRRAPPG
jgi:hypothetical protein